MDSWEVYARSSTALMWGTEAHHKLGDVSRENGDFFVVSDEDDDNYYGNWLSGLGFVNVRFPKSTTRQLSRYEREWLAQHPVVFA